MYFDSSVCFHCCLTCAVVEYSRTVDVSIAIAFDLFRIVFTKCARLTSIDIAVAGEFSLTV